MKKLLIFLFLLVILAVCSFADFGKKIFLNYKLDIAVEMFVDSIPQTDMEFTVQKNGDSYIIDSYDINLVHEIKNSQAITVSFSGSIRDFEELKKNIKVFSEDSVSGQASAIGFMPGLMNYVYVNGKKINIQINFNKNTIKVGMPLIFGSY